MPPRKRPAESDIDDDPDESLSSSPPRDDSSQTSPGRKRRRISDNSDTTPEQNLADTTQYTEADLSDNSSDNDSNDSDAREAATQQLRSRKARDRDKGNVARECGVLESVDLYNFMCHARYEFVLGPLINFVCGKNGSGKSAILTAIILCLGGKASATNRGASMKKFIKEGAEQARIICRIKNQGEDAYMHDEYGDRIEVERHFSASGTSGYKIRNASGRQISTKRADLEPILDHFALQIDNPLNVLSQDNARSFISSANSAEKYKFFIKGVQLEQLDQDYTLLAEQMHATQQKLITSKSDVETLERVMEQAKERRELAKRRDGISDQIRDVRRQRAWIQVVDQEKIVDAYVKENADADAKIAQAEAAFAILETRFQEADQAHQNTGVTLEEAVAAIDQAKNEQRELTNSYQEAKSTLANSQAEVRSVKDTISNHGKTIAKQEEAIQLEEQRLLEINGGGAARRLEELETAKSTVRQAKEDFEQHKAGRQNIEQTIRDCKNLEKERSEEKDRRQLDVENQQQRLNELRAKGDRQLGAFAPNTENLLRAIEREMRWEQKPIGPLGKHVKLKKAEWSSIIERMFGNSLNGFVVCSRRDANLLAELKRKNNCPADVFITRNLPLTPREPDEQFETVLRVLEIDNELVKKHLVLAHAIEQQLLFASLDEATSAMYDNGRIRNVKGCFALNPHDKRKGILLKYTNSGDPSQDPVNAWDKHPRMKTDIEATIAMRTQALRECQDQLATAKNEWQSVRRQKVEAEQSLKRHDRREQDLRIATQKAEDEVDVIENAIREDNVESGRLDVLKAALQETEEQKVLAESQYMDAVNAHDVKKKEMRARHQRKAEVDTQVEELENTRSVAEDARRRTDKVRAQQLREKNNAEARIQDAQTDRRRAQAREDVAREDLVVMIAEARKTSERVNVPEGATRESLDAKGEKLKAEKRRYVRELGMTMEEASNAALNAVKAYKQASKDYGDQVQLEDALRKSLDDRRFRWRKFRHHITVRARMTFLYLLSERGFRGELLMSHSKRLLDLRIEPDITKRSAAGRDTKTLSGGEKSFSQICLLLAMWEAMGSPLRCLDEFDVFMDAVNRNLSVKMIIEAARDSIGKQYILISPGSKADITPAPDVRVCELGAPQRGQGNLDANVERSRR